MSLKGKVIFVVEDNINNRIVFQMTLMRAGASVEFERWGDNAIQRLNRLTHVDLIILDLMLANDVSGFDLHDQIREIPEHDDTPIIAVSAMEPAVAIPLAQEKGFTGFIAKPIDNQHFEQQILDILAGNAIWSAGPHHYA
jgi:CheY-like chemotaxis protein